MDNRPDILNPKKKKLKRQDFFKYSAEKESSAEKSQLMMKSKVDQ